MPDDAPVTRTVSVFTEFIGRVSGCPSQTIGQGPIDKERSADDVFLRDRAPETRVEAVAGVVAHGHARISRNIHDGFLIGEYREIADVSQTILLRDSAVDMARPLLDCGGLFGSKP